MDIYYKYNSMGNLSGITYYIGTTAYTYYVVCNSRGDVEAIYNGAGTLVAQYRYDSWGNILSITDANGVAITDQNNVGNVNPIRFRGYYFDTEIGMYYLQSRYYDPTTCRMINADDMDTLTATMDGITDKNLFAYCDNNPVMRSDDNGEFWGGLLALAGGGTSSAGLFSSFIASLAVPGLGEAMICVLIGCAIGGALVYGYHVYHVKTKSNPDPNARAGQKKRDSSKKNKSRKKDDWKDKSNNRRPQPPKSHKPMKDHQKY